MYVYRNLPINIIWRFGWINFIIFIAWASFVWWLHWRDPAVQLPFALISTVGVGVAIYLSFKNSQSYDRQWEARKIWGELARNSKVLANQLRVHINRDRDNYAEELQGLCYRQLAFLNALKLQLRKRVAHSRVYRNLIKRYYFGEPGAQEWEQEVGKFLDKREYAALLEHSGNMAFQLLCSQYEALYQLKQKGSIDEFRQMDMNKSIDGCIEAQGKAERIKNTPFPRQYAFFSKAFCWIFVLMLPLGLITQLAESGIMNYYAFTGLCMLISWVFITMELVGDFSEDPFENSIADVPMSAICRNVEIELRTLLGESDIPPALVPHGGYLL